MRNPAAAGWSALAAGVRHSRRARRRSLKRSSIASRLATFALRKLSRRHLVSSQAPSSALLQRLCVLPDLRRSRRRGWRQAAVAAACWTNGRPNWTQCYTRRAAASGVCCAARDGSRSSTFRSTSFPICCTAFRQDQIVTRYPRFDDLLGYCQYSANPVGHLVLYLCGYRDAERQKLSDYTCTALAAGELLAGRCRRLTRRDASIFRWKTSPSSASARATVGREARHAEFLAMMKFEVERARDWFQRGLPLAKTGRPPPGASTLSYSAVADWPFSTPSSARITTC